MARLPNTFDCPIHDDGGGGGGGASYLLTDHLIMLYLLSSTDQIKLHYL
jgi:hypothetical protein